MTTIAHDGHDWQSLDWHSIGQAVGLKKPMKAGDKQLFQSTVYGLVTLAEQNDGELTVDVTKVPGFKPPNGFVLYGSLRSEVTIPYRQDGELIPAKVIAYRLECALQGRDIDLQHGMTTTGLRATPELIRQLKAGTIVEVIKAQHYCGEQEASVKVGARATVECLEISGEEYEDGAELTDEDLADIDWLNDVVWAVYLCGEAKLEAHIGLMFSDFVIAAEQTLETPHNETAQPE